eukprot:6486761-Amphidinium_carterae.1
MVRNWCKMRHLLQFMCTWAWQRRPSSAHTPHNTGPGEAWAPTSPNVPRRNTLLLDFGMPGIRLLRERTSLTSSDLPGCPASLQAENQPNSSALGVQHELGASSTYVCGVGITSRGKRMRLSVIDLACVCSRRLVNQPMGSFVSVQFVACVRTRDSRTLAATLLKRLALRS